MSRQTMAACISPKESESVADVINRLRVSDVTTAVNRLMSLSEGDPLLLCALAFTALGLDEHTRERRLDEVIRDRTTMSCDAPAQREPTEASVRPDDLVEAELDQRPASEAVAPPYLTQRQREVLDLLSDGLTVQAIARRLSLSPRTVGKHLERVYRRLGTSDRLTTVIRAQRYGLLARGVQQAVGS